MRTKIISCDGSRDLIRLALTHNRQKPISIRELSRRLSYNSDRALGMVYNGQRVMSADMLSRLSGYIALTERELIFGQLLLRREALRKKNKTTEIVRLEEEISGFRKTPLSYKTLNSDTLERFDAWYFVPLLRLIKSQVDGLNLKQIQTCFFNKIKDSDLQNALNTLVAIGEVELKSSGNYISADKRYVNTKTDVPSAAIEKIIKAQLQRALVAHDEQSILDRVYITKTLIISKSKMAKIKARIRELLEQMSDDILAEDAPADGEVYQLSLQFFRQAGLA